MSYETIRRKLAAGKTIILDGGTGTDIQRRGAPMSEDPTLRPGSPGKQCLLRVMQTMFDEGFATFDMGEGFTDEKRHWCNEQIPVRHHYIPITRRGAVAASLHRSWQLTRARIKSDPKLLELAKRLRGVVARLKGGSAPTPVVAASED